MDVLALDGAYNGANVRIADGHSDGDLIVVGEGDEAETYTLRQWVPSSSEMVLMTTGGIIGVPAVMAEEGMSV